MCVVFFLFKPLLFRCALMREIAIFRDEKFEKARRVAQLSLKSNDDYHDRGEKEEEEEECCCLICLICFAFVFF